MNFDTRLDKYNRKYLAEILYGFIQRDYVKVAEVHFQAGLIPRDASKEEFAQALRSVGEPIFGQTIKDISGGNLLAQLFEITEKFNIEINNEHISSGELDLEERIKYHNIIVNSIIDNFYNFFTNYLLQIKRKMKI